jgi:hypothetical protein
MASVYSPLHAFDPKLGGLARSISSETSRLSGVFRTRGTTLCANQPRGTPGLMEYNGIAHMMPAVSSMARSQRLDTAARRE